MRSGVGKSVTYLLTFPDLREFNMSSLFTMPPLDKFIIFAPSLRKDKVLKILNFLLNQPKRVHAKKYGHN